MHSYNKNFTSRRQECWGHGKSRQIQAPNWNTNYMPCSWQQCKRWILWFIMIHKYQYKGILIRHYLAHVQLLVPWGSQARYKLMFRFVMQTSVFCFNAWRNITTYNKQIFMFMDAIVARHKIRCLIVAFQAFIENRDKCKSVRKSTIYWRNRNIAQALDGWKSLVHKKKKNLQKVILLRTYMVAHPKPSSIICMIHMWRFTVWCVILLLI